MVPLLAIHLKRGVQVSQLGCRPLLHFSYPVCGELPFLTSYSTTPHAPPLVIMSSQTQLCHNSSPHTFQSGFGVSFTLNPALWLGPVKSASQSDKHTLAKICLCWINTVIRRLLTSSRTFTFCFFSCDSYVCHQSGPLKDMTVQRCDSQREAQMFWWWAHVGQKKQRRLPPLMPLWYVHKETLKVSQWSGTGIPNKIVYACLWKQIKIILTSAARNVLNLEPRRGEIRQLITPNKKTKNPQRSPHSVGRPPQSRNIQAVFIVSLSWIT